MGHDVDLGVDGIRAPDDDKVGLRHLARIGTGELARPGDKTRPGGCRADGRELARVALRVAQALDAVAHDEAHRAGEEVGPHRLAAVTALGVEQSLSGEVERVVPRDPLELSRAFRPAPLQWMEQPIVVMDAFGVARDLGADDTGRVVVLLRPAHAADPAIAEQLHVERTGRRTVVGARRVSDLRVDALLHRKAPVLSCRRQENRPAPLSRIGRLCLRHHSNGKRPRAKYAAWGSNDRQIAGMVRSGRRGRWRSGETRGQSSNDRRR